MNTLKHLGLLALLGLAIAAGPLAGQTADQTAIVSALVANVQQAAPEDRAELIQAAISADPNVAPFLVAALITALPNEAPALTNFVVQAVLALPPQVTNDTKSIILTAVAANAERAALQIPEGAVANRVTTVNDVKNELANVGDLLPAVEAFITPITEATLPIRQAQVAAASTTPPPTPATGGNPPINNDPLPTQTIVSDDRP